MLRVTDCLVVVVVDDDCIGLCIVWGSLGRSEGGGAAAQRALGEFDWMLLRG